MLFNQDLESIIFNKHKYIDCDELIIISGYIGPVPVKKLRTLGIKTTVIYGMYGSQSISWKLHNVLMSSHIPNINEIFYSKIPVHSKCYIWKKNGDIVYTLIGSANFSNNGLNIPFRETLAETTNDTFAEMDKYLSLILTNSVLCDSVNISPTNVIIPYTQQFNSLDMNISNFSCDMLLYDPRTDEVPEKSGLNWGASVGNTNPGDAYIPIRTAYIKNYPNLFPPKQAFPVSSIGGRNHRQNDSIELIWDDNTLMTALLEGTQKINNLQYPKQLSSFPSKNLLGQYIRNRLGLSSVSIIKKLDLDHYGRDTVTISLLQDGTYYMDFSI